MIRRLEQGLAIPAAVPMQPYELEGGAGEPQVRYPADQTAGDRMAQSVQTL